MVRGGAAQRRTSSGSTDSQLGSADRSRPSGSTRRRCPSDIRHSALDFKTLDAGIGAGSPAADHRTGPTLTSLLAGFVPSVPGGLSPG